MKEVERAAFDDGIDAEALMDQAGEGIANAILADFEIPHAARYLAVAPISHVTGTKVLPTLMRGGTVHMLKGFDPEAVLKTIERERINFARGAGDAGANKTKSEDSAPS